MWNKLILTTILCLILLSAKSQNYHYSINLNEIKSDEIEVELVCPPINANEIIFYFPKTIPGTYSELDYGRYIKNFIAIDESGNKLKVEKRNINTYLILNAKNIKTIKYKVEDTFDKKLSKKKRVFEPAGTGFEEDEYFVINNGGLFGCFEEMEEIPFLLDFSKDESLKGYSSLSKKSTENKSFFESKDYHQLIDCPILFTNQEVEQFKVGKCNITIASYSENDSAASIIKKEIEPMFDAILEFTDSLPVEEYNILMFVDNQKEIGEMLASGKIKFFKIPALIRLMSKGYGALEHGTSSFYFLPNFGSGDINYTQILKDVIIHEFMHIYTPLNLHSELIGDFDYLNPKMSKHLWLYEGVTEYFSIQIQMQGEVLEPLEALKEIRSKIFSAQRYPNSMSFTEMSENILDKPYKKQYYQVYERGAVIAMLLDFEIMKLTNGEKTLKSVIFELSKEYGSTKSFDEEDFITEFVGKVHPGLQIFFDNYIIGTNPLDIQQGFDVVGIDYYQKLDTNIPINILSKKDNGVKVGLFSADGFYEVKKVKENDIVGFQVGDKVDRQVTKNVFLDENGEFIPEGKIVSISVHRNDKELQLSFPAKYKEGILYNHIKLNPNKTDKQQQLYDIWTGPSKVANYKPQQIH